MAPELEQLRTHLANTPRDLLFLELALATTVPVQEILQLRVDDIIGLHPGDPLPFSNSHETATLTVHIQEALQKYLTQTRYQPQDYLFRSRKGSQPLSIQSVSRIVRSWRQTTGIHSVNGLPGLRQMGRTEIKEKKSLLPLPEIQPSTIQQRVYHEVEKAILSGRIMPGQKLTAKDLAQSMNVSSIPVREALGRLEAKGLIVPSGGRGKIVNSLSRANLQEILQLRLILETKAAELAVAYVDEEFLKQLSFAHEEYLQARKTHENSLEMETNRNFHFLIYQQAQAPILLELITNLHDKSSPYFHILFGKINRSRQQFKWGYNHENIVNSLKKKDPTAVKRWIQKDIEEPTTLILDLFEEYTKGGILTVT